MREGHTQTHRKRVRKTEREKEREKWIERERGQAFLIKVHAA